MKKALHLSFIAITLSCCTAFSKPQWPVKNLTEFKETMVNHYHINPQLMNKIITAIRLKVESKKAKKSISNAKNPYENNTWETYSNRLINTRRIQQGILYLKEHQQAFQQADKIYHVPASVITAITGIETNYGTRTGNYPAYLALGTLAFKYPHDKLNPNRRNKRQAFFQKELAELIILAQKNNLKTLQIKSSYAGALGIPQFMPSSYRHYAVNEQGNKHGDIDLLSDHNDSIMSIANYLHQHKWRERKFIAVPITYSEDNNQALKQLIKSKQYHNLSWYQQRNIKPQTLLSGNDVARVIALNTSNKNIKYWLVSKNFNAILRYNPRVNYAMAVYQLSKKLTPTSV